MKLWHVEGAWYTRIVRAESAEAALELLPAYERDEYRPIEVRELTTEGEAEVLVEHTG